jgi:opacity protein-like surface antigen
MKKNLLILVWALLPLCLWAQEQEEADARVQQSSRQTQQQPEREKRDVKVFTGFSAGIMLHMGYMFSDDPRKLFSNDGLGNSAYTSSLPKDGVGLGLGAAVRFHLINCIHLSAEGHISTMPLMKSGSSVRTGWAGASCDFYFDLGKIRPFLGGGVGGGLMQRLYVPDEAPIIYLGDSAKYNASYAKTPFFYIDPYAGLEIELNNSLALMIRVDYMLPFGRTSSGLTNLSSDVNWSNFMTPSGPRLYVGLMLGQMKKSKNKDR